MRRISSGLLALIIVCLATPACETVKGVGRDIESAGEAIERAVN